MHVTFWSFGSGVKQKNPTLETSEKYTKLQGIVFQTLSGRPEETLRMVSEIKFEKTPLLKWGSTPEIDTKTGAFLKFDRGHEA